MHEIDREREREREREGGGEREREGGEGGGGERERERERDVNSARHAVTVDRKKVRDLSLMYWPVSLDERFPDR